jgi:hypothetical protein
MDVIDNTRTLPCAMNEILKQLTDKMAPYVLTTLGNMYKEAKAQNKKVFISFQKKLREIPTWNSTVIRQRTQEIEACCPHLGLLDKLIGALFVLKVKILSSIRISNSTDLGITIKLPANDTYVHQVYIHTASLFYKNPHLITESKSVREGVVQEGVEKALREMLPMNEMLTAYLGHTINEDNTISPMPGNDHETPPPPIPAAAPLAPGGPPPVVVPSTETANDDDEDDDDDDDDDDKVHIKTRDDDDRDDDDKHDGDDGDDKHRDDDGDRDDAASVRSHGSPKKDAERRKELFPDADDF